MGKFDEEFREYSKGPEPDQEWSQDYWKNFFLYKIADELAEANRLTRQRLTMAPNEIIPIDEAVDKA